MKPTAWVALALVASCLSTGCVTRRYLITSDPPGAIVYRDGQYIGPTPVEQPFTYYGNYRFRLIKDGYEPLDVEPELVMPWYQLPGIDFFAEHVTPYPFLDVQAFHFQLQPSQAVRHDDVRNRAEQLRQQGSAIKTPPGTEGPLRPRPPQPAPLPPGAVPPPGAVVPETAPLTVPSPAAPSPAGR